MKWKGEIRIPKVQTFLQVDNTCWLLTRKGRRDGACNYFALASE
jgi:hypothetical protein